MKAPRPAVAVGWKTATGSNTLAAMVDRQGSLGLFPKPPAPLAALLRLAKAEGFRGREGEIFSHYSGEKKWFLLGVGAAEKLTPEKVRRLAASWRRRLSRRRLRSVSLAPYLPSAAAAPAYLAAAYEGFALAGYHFNKYVKRQPAQPGSLQLVFPPQVAVQSKVQAALGHTRTAIEACHLTCDLINEQSSAKRPPQLAAEISALARAAGLQVKLFSPAAIRAQGFPGLEAVAKGSNAGAYLVHFSYHPRIQPRRRVCLIGKGITFDSGGLNLKTALHMRSMKSDMAGAATALGTALAAARMKLPLHLEVLLPLAENMPAAGAFRPGDILLMKNGKSVEVLDTDAEGRLILADALCYAQKLPIDEIIEISTLTGGCLYALGRYCAALLTRDERLSGALLAASQSSGEKLWRLPMFEDYRRELRGQLSDLRNIGRTQAGTITAALFLQEFAGAIPFAHLDIAGPSFFEERPDLPYWETGASGYGVRLLLDYLKAQGQGASSPAGLN